MKNRSVSRFCLGIMIGLVVSGLLMLAEYLIEGIDPADLWDHVTICGFFGVTVGAVVGVAWEIFAGPNVPGDQVNPPGPDPDTASRSN
jgi:hypothetical protein